MNKLKIIKKDGSILGNLNLNLYNLNEINETIKEFQEVCDIILSEKDEDNYIEIELVSKVQELNSKEIFFEFCNYLIGNMKNKSLI